MADKLEIEAELQKLANSEVAFQSKNYLKSPFQFYGIRVPILREISKKFKNLEIYDTYNLFDELWNSGYHEEMSLAIFILAFQNKKFDIETLKFLFPRLEKIKTWDHADYVASDILGKMLLENSWMNSELWKMSDSKNPWIRRISIVSNIWAIKKGKIELVFKLAEKLAYDENIFVQKGTGWMLRECGKKERLSARNFVLMHLDMKPAAFSYATERMKELKTEKRKFLKGK